MGWERLERGERWRLRARCNGRLNWAERDDEESNGMDALTKKGRKKDIKAKSVIDKSTMAGRERGDVKRYGHMKTAVPEGRRNDEGREGKANTRKKWS